MVTPKTIEIVKSTAPFLAENGEKLTRYFYERMFSHNPEVKPLFNTSNQGGTQQRALAAAIAAYAANIDNLEVLTGAVELIAQKHASLQVKAEHYPIVGENLLESIKHLLGDAASDDIINAWAEAYQFLAEILINAEKDIYVQNAQKPGGWTGFKSFQVIRKVPESDVVTSFYLAPADGSTVPGFIPGQYITVRFPTEDNSTTMRNYSLSHGPSGDWIRISVKREDAPEGVGQPGYISTLMHKTIDVGDHIEVAPPCGEFVFETPVVQDRPVCFMAGGIGITPVLSMLQAALNDHTQQKVVLIYAAVNEKMKAFHEEIEQLRLKHKNLEVHYRYSDEPSGKYHGQQGCSTGFVDEGLIRSLVPDLSDANYYFCGPKPFMVNVYRTLIQNEVPPAQINFEFFGPREEIEAVHRENEVTA